MTEAATAIDELIEQWTLEGHRPVGRYQPDPHRAGDITHDETYQDLFLQLAFLSEKSYSRFVPALYPPFSPVYLDRLWRWLTNEGVTAVQQRQLFEFATRIAYFSFDDFLQLYRTAFLQPVTRWIIDELRLSLGSPDFDSRLEEERLRRTWYCPITDSMVISEFYHANGISGIDQRPAFRSLMRFGMPERIETYMRERQLSRLVLIEDFVCTGTQASNVVSWAVENLKCPVLFVPLIVCPSGAETLERIATHYGDRLHVLPVLKLDNSVFVNLADPLKDRLLAQIAEFAKTIHPNIVGDPDTSFGPFGFGDTAATVVLFSNTPDNSLPFIHHHAKAPSNWQALFPRVTRETL